MLMLNRSLLNREYVLINVLKALASIISMCSLHVIFLSKITPRYLAADPRYIASTRTAQRTLLPTALLLLRACLLRPLPNNGHCLHSHYLATAVV
jgi:hypothetical protein